jgi:hypothetical protein
VRQVADFLNSKRIAILQSYGTTICHVPTSELEKIVKPYTSRYGLRHDIEGVIVEVHDFLIEEPLVRFLAHWIHFREPEEAVKATINRQRERPCRALDEEWLAFLIKALNAFDDPEIFTCDITDSLIDQFFGFLNCGGLDHIDQVYQICRESCKTHILTKIFAIVFVHDKKQFARQAPTCDYDRAVHEFIYAWLADVLANDQDWSKIPKRLRLGYQESTCLYHGHAQDQECYEQGRIINPA